MPAHTTSTILVAFSVRLFAAILGAFVAYLSPTFPFILLCTLAIVADCFTAWRLSRRVHEANPDLSDGKFKSAKASKIFTTFIKILICLFLAYLADKLLFPDKSLYLQNIVAGSFCFTQFISILENESSQNGATWAKLLQKVLVDKAERHLNTDLSDFKPKDNETKSNAQED